MSDLIKNKSNQELLNQWVFDTKEWNEKRLETSTENKINEQVEKSFQQFFNENKNTLEKLTDQEKQKWFNDRLDWEVTRILDREKINEIKWVNWDIEKSLKSLIFEVELNELEWQIQSQREEESTQTTLNSGISIEWIIASQVTSEMLDTLVSTINTTNFAEKQYVVECLNRWKREDIRRIQYLLIWKKDNYIAWKSWNKESCLSRYGTDWLLWNETYNALIDYIDSHKSNTETGEQTATVWAWITSWSRTETWRWSSNTASSWSRTEIWGWSSSGTRVPSSAERDNSASWQTASKSQSSSYRWETAWAIESSDNSLNETTEYLDKSHNIKKLYTWKWGENITIATNLPDYEIVPTVLQDQFKFEQDNNWNITYILPNENWEWTVSIKVGDKIHTITIKSKENKEQSNWPKNIYDEIAALDLQNRRDNENFKKIPQYVQKLKDRYQELVPSKDSLPASQDGITELNKLKWAMNRLLAAYNLNEIEKSIAKIKDGTGWITTEKWQLNYYIIPDAIIYIGWKFLSKDEYLQWTNTKKKTNIEKTLYKKGTIDLPADWSDFWYDNKAQNLKNIKFKTLILSDDELFTQKNISWTTEIQYDAYRYWSNLKKKEFDKKARVAVNRLTRWLDDDLSIVSQNYNMMPGERTNLGKLRQWLKTLVKLDEDSKDKENNITITDVFNFIDTKYSENFSWWKKEWKGIMQSKYPSLNDSQAWHLAELWALYTAYKKDQDTHKMWDYFGKVMWLLENYFVRWVWEWDKKVTTIVDMYKREEIWIDKDVIDADKERKAIKLLFKPGKKDNQNLLWWIWFEKSDKLTALENIIKNNKFNLTDFFAKWWIWVNPVDLSKPEKSFYAQYEQYLEKLNSGDLDDNNKPNISESTYYNAVFDFLVWIWEARKDIVSAVNSLRLYDSEVADDEAKKCWFEYGNEMKLICMLTDTNFDGREDFADIDGFRTWLETKSIYKDAKVDKKYGLIQKQPIQNLLDYATQYALRDSDTQYTILKGISDNLKDIESDKAFYDKLREQLGSNRQTLLYIQKVLLNTPVEWWVEKIFKYGASPETNTEDNTENHELSASEKAIKEIMDSQEFNATFERERKKLVDQWLQDSPVVKAKFKPIIAAWVLANLRDNGDVSHEVWLSVGGTWNTKVWDITLVLWVWATVDWGFDPDSVWIGISRWKSWPAGKNTNIYTWAWTWARVGDNVTFLASTWFSVSTLVNKKKLSDNLKAHPETYFNIWTSIWAWFSNNSNHPRWVYWEIHMWYSQDVLVWINKQTENIKNELWWDKWVIMDVLSQIDLWEGTSQQWKQAIRTELEKKYYSKWKKMSVEDVKQLNQATDNIYAWLAHYMTWINMDGVDEATQENIKKDIANNLAEAYAIARRNQSISDLQWKTKLTWLTFSIIYVLWMLYPISLIWFNISTFKWLYASETSESKARYQEDLMTWAHAEFQWNDIFYDDSDPDNIKPKYNEKKDKDGNVVIDKDGNTVYECPVVNWINDKLQVANWNVQLPKITFVVIPESVSINWRQPERVLLKLPKDLYKYVNINIKSKLQDSVQTDTNGDLLVPWNTMIRLLTSDKPNTGKFNLIIWGLQAEDSDLVVAPNQQMYGAPTEYAWEVSTYQLDVDRFNDNLSAFIESHQEDEYSDFPIQKCEKVISESWESKALLKLTPSLNIQDMGLENSKTEIKDGYIYTPTTGTLTVYKNKEWKFQLYYQSNPKHDLKINYEIEWQDQELSVEDQETRSESRQEEPYTYNIIFDESTDIFDVAWVEDLFSWIEKELSDVDNGKWISYVGFMENACDVVSGNTLDQWDYDEAYDKLLQMLDKTNISKLNDLKGKLRENNMTTKDKVMVVDRFKMIFSYLSQLTDWKVDGQNLNAEINRRGTKYKELLGYDRNTRFPLTTDYRSTIVEKLKTNTQIDRVPIQNLFGMTAFYKTWWVDGTHTRKVKQQLNQAYGYSMTQMWHTNVLGWLAAMEDIWKDELTNTREWFVNNLEKSDVHSELLCNMIEKNVNSLLKNGKVNVKWNIKLDKAILLKLLKWESDIVIWKSIDNWQENDIMLSWDLKYVFYLLWECANESIWVQLNWLTVKTNKTIIIEQISTVPGESSPVTVKPVTVEGVNTKRTGGPWVATSTHEAKIQKNISRQKDISFAMWAGVKKSTTWSRPQEGSGTANSDPQEHGTTGNIWNQDDGFN